jgi:phenylacetate-CoA ligase
MPQGPFFDPEWETAPVERLHAAKLPRLRRLLAEVLATNPFYRGRLKSAGLAAPEDLGSLEQFATLPFTTKADLVADQAEHPPFGTNLTYPLERYVRIHNTSGTSGGRPLRVLDTADGFRWFVRCWEHVAAAAGVNANDRVFTAFSFGPFIGFWAGFEAAQYAGALVIPGGGLDSMQRLRSIQELRATVLLCTPTYALRLAEVARSEGIDMAASDVRALIVAGEPGGSIPATRHAIDEAWGATTFDHTGLTEVGATGLTCRERSGVHLIESEFLFEVIDPATGTPVSHGTLGELVVTNFGRPGNPMLRYRTGDLVELDDAPCDCGRTWPRMKDGILGRVDDMVVVRGVNVFPSSIEDIVREYRDVAEFQIELRRERQMDALELTLEPVEGLSSEAASQLARKVGDEIHRRLLLRVPCNVAPPQSLPRFELKARRTIRRTMSADGS